MQRLFSSLSDKTHNVNQAVTEVNGFSISARQLSKRFNREWIFRDLSYEFTAPGWYAVTGPNGSGKSTLLHVLWGQVPPTSGYLACTTGHLIISPDAMSSHIAVAAPYMDLIGELTLMEHLNFHFKMKSIRNQMELSDLLEIMYLQDAADKYVRNFSSGMKQRLKLGLAFYTQADVVFLDEPGTNLDRSAFEWYVRELDKLRGKCLVIIASNNPEEYPADITKIDLTAFKKAATRS